MPKKAAALFLICVSLATWISCGKTTSHYLYGAVPAGNEILVYREDPNSGVLTALSFSPVSAGQGVQSLALNSSGTFLYAANSGESNVSLFAINSDGSLTEQGARTPTGSTPTVLAMDKAGANLYVMNSGGQSISVFSIASSGGMLTLIGTFTVGLQPTNMALSPSNILYVTGQGALGGTVQAFTLDTTTTPPTLNSIGSFPTGTIPYGIAIPSSGSFLYISNTQSNSISEFQVQSDGSLTQLSSSPFGEGYQSPTWMLIDKSGKYLYVANEGSSNLMAYTIGSDGSLTALSSTIAPIATGSQPNLIASDPNGEFLFVGNQSSPVVQSFALDAGNGALTSVESYKVTATPTSIVVVP